MEIGSEVIEIEEAPGAVGDLEVLGLAAEADDLIEARAEDLADVEATEDSETHVTTEVQVDAAAEDSEDRVEEDIKSEILKLEISKYRIACSNSIENFREIIY